MARKPRIYIADIPRHVVLREANRTAILNIAIEYDVSFDSPGLTGEKYSGYSHDCTLPLNSRGTENDPGHIS